MHKLQKYLKQMFHHDPALFVHSMGVTNTAWQIASVLKLEVPLQLLICGALLHDLGKTGVDQGILNKKGPLTSGEREIIKEHTVIGAQILETEGYPRELWEIVLYHHERWDGKGYHGLKGEQIPLTAQIVSLADAMDAMLSNRPYRPALSPLEVYAEIENCCSTQFSPQLVERLRHSEFWPGGESIQERVSALIGLETRWLETLSKIIKDWQHPLVLIQNRKLAKYNKCYGKIILSK